MISHNPSPRCLFWEIRKGINNDTRYTGAVIEVLGFFQSQRRRGKLTQLKPGLIEHLKNELG